MGRTGAHRSFTFGLNGRRRQAPTGLSCPGDCATRALDCRQRSPLSLAIGAENFALAVNTGVQTEGCSRPAKCGKLGRILPGVEPGGRLEPAGKWNALFTHRVRIASADEVDAAIQGWLGDAYRMAA